MQIKEREEQAELDLVFVLDFTVIPILEVICLKIMFLKFKELI
jgi:hypothetical protein